jgi:outer membrane protein TolC
MANELIKVYEENIRRIEIQLKQIRSLVVSGIRPGVDTSLFQAELSKADIDLYTIRKYEQQQQIDLAQLTGLPQVQVIADSSLAQHLPSFNLSDSSSIHPLIEYGKQLIRLQESGKAAVQKSNLPKLSVWGTAYARGSGIRYDGIVKSGDGLGLSRYNYGLGLQLSIPVLKFTDIRLQLQKQNQLIRVYQSQLQETQLQLTHDSLTAELALMNAIKIAGKTPVQLKAATVAYRSLLSRYNSGLASFADLIQAQYGLVKAETDIRQSYIEAWKALLLKAAARGDINLFLNQVN